MCKTVQLFKHLCVTPGGRNPSTVAIACTALPILILHCRLMRASTEIREEGWQRKRRAVKWTGECKWFIFLQVEIWGFLTLCTPGRPSKGYLKPPWRGAGWPLAGYCHPFCLKQCSSRWMKTGCHRELLLCLHDLSGHIRLETVQTCWTKLVNVGWQADSKGHDYTITHDSHKL